MKRSVFSTTAAFGAVLLFNACSRLPVDLEDLLAAHSAPNIETALNGLQCTAQAEQKDYSIYRMCADSTYIGDVAPYYDSSALNYKLYFLKDIWSAGGQKHPWYAFVSDNFHSYSETASILSSSGVTCDQDYAVGAGAVVKANNIYYAFYTGHNPDITSCTNGVKREGIMLATATNPTSVFTKNNSFATIYAPTGIGYDENDNWRDPFVIWDAAGNNWMMLIAARKNHNGSWRGVIAKYTSSDLLNWSYQGVFYDGGSTNYFNMECPGIFHFGGYYYLIFSDQSISSEKQKYVHYRKSTSVNGPWSLPSGPERIDGNAFYAGKAVPDAYGDAYLFGWCHTRSGGTDNGSWAWGGNLVTHKIYALPNGDLATAIPHTVKSWLETTQETIIKDSQWGNVTNTSSGTQSYRLISNADFDVANVLYHPVNRAQYLITTTFSYSSSSKDFGFLIGACDGYENTFQLRFVPSENKLKFEKKNRSALDSIPDNDVPLSLSANTSYKVQIVVENSVVVAYINDQVAFTNRIYKASNTSWGIFSDHSDVTFSNITVTHP